MIECSHMKFIRIFNPCFLCVFKPFQGDQFVYYEDWGETLVSKSTPVLCVLDIEGGNVSVLEGIPDNISPGQVWILYLLLCIKRHSVE